ncbi:MAG: hypothetical protein JSR46_07745 [Verrucomicrobia bacterium]|nr:hypothetical protein [Verrucomicrobiota bacterium]
MSVSNNSNGSLTAFCVGAFVYFAGCQDEKENKSLARKEKLLGGAIMLTAVIERVLYYSELGSPFAMAHQIAPPPQHGEWWMNNFYPYSQYPHGHFDCTPGSTTFDSLRAEDAEQRRWSLFFEDNICVRGICELAKRVGSTVLSCFADGTESSFDK